MIIGEKLEKLDQFVVWGQIHKEDLDDNSVEMIKRKLRYEIFEKITLEQGVFYEYDYEEKDFYNKNLQEHLIKLSIKVTKYKLRNGGMNNV